jgi:cytochrome c oxidase subunit II
MYHKIIALLLVILLSTFGVAYANSSINMPFGVTEVSQKIYYLHMTVLWICVFIGVIVFGVMFYAIIFHRKSLGHQAAHFHESTKVEIFWTIIPFLILVAIAVPATKTLLVMDNLDDADMTVKVTGSMWRWQYEYIGTGVGFTSNLSTPYEQTINRDEKDENYLREVDNPLVLPVGRKVRLLTTATDVIHSWWVPDFAVKKDAIPGFINETWVKINVPGVYRGQCAELCGARHGFMPIVVRAVSAEEFDRWMATQVEQLGEAKDAHGTS